MKTLTAQLLRHVLLLAAAIQLQTHSLAQCTVNAGADLTKCFGSLALLGANVTATGQSPFQYSWNGGATWSASPTYNVTATVNNTYTVSVQDANGCISTDQISLTVLALPTADAGADVSICPAAPVQLCGTASSPNGAITTQIWLPGGSASACINVAPSSTTTYTYTVGDAAGCQASNTVQVTVYNALPVNAGTDQTLCLSVGSQQLTGIPAGGTWSGTGVNAAGLFTASTIGNYTLTYTRVSAQGCSYSDHMVMTVIDPSPPNGGPDYVVCIDTPTMSLPNVGTWSGSALVTPGGIFTPSVAGSYVLTVTNTSGGCTVTDNISIDVMALPTVNAGVDQNICTGGTAQLNGIASSVNGTITNVAWGGSWVSNASILNPTATPPGTSNYILYVTDNFNCTTSDQMTVFVNSYPMVNAGSDETVCSNALPTQLAGFSPAGGTWSGAGVNASGIFTPTIAGNFTLTYTYTSAQGCTASDTKVMTVIAPDVINAGVDQSVCLNANPIQLMSGGTWTGSAYVTAAGIFTPSAIGSYTLTYTTTSGLCQSSDQLVVTVLPLPSVNAGADQTICTGQVVSLIATASSANGIISNYAWNGGTVANASAQITTSTPTVATTYTITATDASACYASDNITIQVNSLPAVNAGTDISLCNQPIGQQLGGFSPSGGVWSGANVNASGIFTPDGTGVFTLTYCYTNGNGCTACDDVNVTVTNAPVVNAGVDEAVCLNAAPFNLVTVSTGGTWTATAVLTTGGLFTPNSAGTHTCTYTTGSGTCMASDTKTVTVNSLPAVNAGADASICAGHNHNINANVNGGTGPYNYVWSNAATLSDSDTEDVTAYPNVNTTYSLIVTDANNCSSTDNISINVVALAVADFDVADTSCVNAAIAFTNASTGAASYLWSLGNGSTSTLTSPISTYTLSGSYAVSLTAYNAIGCESTTSGSIEIIDAP
ncbi:MAG: PKD domain-containing protein, partial [Flavobacteriales bacterium]